MKVSRNWLKTFFDNDIPGAAELSELFTFHSFEVEGIEEIKDSAGAVTDHVIDAKILPDRAHYCLSHRGVAEEIHLITGLPLKKDREVGVSPKGNPAIVVPAVALMTAASAADTIFCRRYMARRIEAVAVGDSAPWMKTYLHNIGERSINNIVDATNIVMFDSGQPLHAFDADKVQGSITVRNAKKDERITLLDGKEVPLLETDFVVADDAGPLAIAGVKGGKRAEITKDTKNIMIESANFDPTAVRRTATRLNLRNESSKRFENEITPELAPEGIALFSALIAGLMPDIANTMSDIVDTYPHPAIKTVVTTSREYIDTRLGINIPEKEFDHIISRLGIVVLTGGADEHGQLRLEIPFHRLDLAFPEDIAEEIGRIYGYEKIPGRLPISAGTSIEISKSFYVSEKIKDILSRQGFSEVSLYTLVSKGKIETSYPLSKDKAFAREVLADGIMTCLQKNVPNADLLGLDSIKIFEIGKTFSAEKESLMLSLGFAQTKKNKAVKPSEFLSAAVALVGTELGVSIPVPLVVSKDICHVCEIDLDEILQDYQLPPDASYGDLDPKPAAAMTYKKFSPYPFIVRDIAVLVPEGVQAEEVWKSVEKGIMDAQATALLARYSLFDTFKKDGKDSYAFRMIFQSAEKTLTDEEANKIMENVYAVMKTKAWEVR